MKVAGIFRAISGALLVITSIEFSECQKNGIGNAARLISRHHLSTSAAARRLLRLLLLLLLLLLLICPICRNPQVTRWRCRTIRLRLRKPSRPSCASSPPLPPPPPPRPATGPMAPRQLLLLHQYRHGGVGRRRCRRRCRLCRRRRCAASVVVLTAAAAAAAAVELATVCRPEQHHAPYARRQQQASVEFEFEGSSPPCRLRLPSSASASLWLSSASSATLLSPAAPRILLSVHRRVGGQRWRPRPGGPGGPRR